MEHNQKIINRIYDHIENDQVDKAVFACIRLAKSIKDPFHTLLFLRELYPDKKQENAALYNEVKDLNKEAQKYLWDKSFDYWLEGRTLGYSINDNPEKTVLVYGVGEMQKEINSINETISDLKAPNGMNEFDLAAFTDRYDETKSKFRLKQSAVNTILDRIRTRCFNYASQIEHQLKTQKKADSFLIDVQNSVNSYFSNRDENTYKKLQKATDLIISNNSEDHALLLTAIRRAINSASDYFYPPVKGDVICSDGEKRSMGNEQYINRLHEFVSLSFKSSTSKSLMKAELNYFMTFATKLNNISSKGVHTEVSPSEAKQGLLGLYLLLFNIIEKLK